MRFAAAAIAVAMATLASSGAQANCVQRVVVFEMLGCPHCASTRAFLEGNKIPFERIEVWQNREVQAFMLENFGSSAVPVIINGQKAVKGHTEEGLRKLLCLG
jgi:glutaredoxin